MILLHSLILVVYSYHVSRTLLYVCIINKKSQIKHKRKWNQSVLKLKRQTSWNRLKTKEMLHNLKKYILTCQFSHFWWLYARILKESVKDTLVKKWDCCYFSIFFILPDKAYHLRPYHSLWKRNFNLGLFTLYSYD